MKEEILKERITPKPVQQTVPKSKPCPFCGSEEVSMDEDMAACVCLNCEAIGPQLEETLINEKLITRTERRDRRIRIILAWNVRS